MSNPGNNNEKRTPLIPTSPRAPYRDFGFQMPPSSVTSENIFSYSSTNSIGDELPGDLSLLSDTLQRLDAEIETDIRSGLVKPKKRISFEFGFALWRHETDYYSRECAKNV